MGQRRTAGGDGARSATTRKTNKPQLGFTPQLELLESRLVLFAPTDGLGSLEIYAVDFPYETFSNHLFNRDDLYNDHAAGAYLTGPSSDNPLTIAVDYLESHAADLGILPEDIANHVVAQNYVSEHTGVTHLTLRQTFGGVEVLGADIQVNITADGRIINVSGGFVEGLGTQEPPAIEPSISASTALEALAVALGVTPTGTPTVLEDLGGVEQSQVLSSSGISLDDVPAELQFLPLEDRSVALTWRLVVRTTDFLHWYSVNVDVTTGSVLHAVDWRADSDGAQYEVFPIPEESPDTTTPPGTRTIEVEPHTAASNTSLFGWHDTNGVAGAEFTDTRGNNVDAQEDRNGDTMGGARPNGGAALDFTGALVPLDLTMQPNTYTAASTVNLFYWNNVLHDVHFQYGFDEAAGNFQVTNFSGMGLGGDPLLALAQFGADVGFFNNAFMFTPPDGMQPIMFMLEWDFTSPRRDSDLDNGVIIHEYGHGVSNRQSLLNALQSGGMGEGWSDWWALMFTQETTDMQLDAYPIGNYVLGFPVNGPGIRRFPYSFDMSINPLTYGDFNGGFPNNEVHNAGEIWASALWDLNWLLINKYGFDENLYNGFDPMNPRGNTLAMQLVMDGLKLQPDDPSFLDGRDAILLADVILTGGLNQCEIWQAFARRGMGVSASDGGSGNSDTVVEAFDIPTSASADIVLDEFTSNAATGMPDQLVIQYSILNCSPTAFDFAFFASSDSRFDPSDVEMGPRVTAPDLTIGTHTFTLAGLPYKTLLESLANTFVLVMADIDGVVTEGDETNNDLNFVGVFHETSGGAAPVMMRARDDTDRRADVADDNVTLTAGDPVTIAGLTGSPVSIAAANITNLVFMGVGGNDTLTMTGGLTQLVNGLGGNGDDVYDVTGLDSASTLDGQAGIDTVVAANDTDFTLSDSSLMRTGFATVMLVSIEGAALTGAGSVNNFTVQDWSGVATLNGANAGDVYNVQLGPIVGTIRAMDTGATGTDVLNVIGTSGPDTVTLSSSLAAIGVVAYSGIEQLSVMTLDGADRINLDGTTAGLTATIDAGAGDDIIDVSGTSQNFDTVVSVPTILGGDGADRVIVHDEANPSPATYTINDVEVRRNPSVTYMMVEQVEVHGTTLADTFIVSPSLTIEFFIDGNLPPPGSIGGDLLLIDFTSVFDRQITLTGPGMGQWTFGSGHLPVNFVSIEQFNGVDRIAVASEAGRGAMPLVNLLDIEGRQLLQFLAYEPDFRGGIRVATGDVNSDGIPDIVTAPTRCNEALVRVFNGLNGALIDEFPALYPFYTLGASPAVGDVNGDGINDIVISALRGPSVVQVFTGPGFSRERSFLAFGEDFIGGATVAVGDINSDGRGDIIVGSGSGIESVVRVFDFTTLNVLREFMPYDATYRGGVAVAAGDYTGDGIDDIITAQQRRGEGLVRVFDGASGALVTSFQAFNSPRYAPVFVGVAEDASGGPTVDIVAAQGSDGRIREVRRFRDTNGDGQVDAIDVLLANDPDLLFGFVVG
jgi:extracellular elastinolytic metalloproteinase